MACQSLTDFTPVLPSQTPAEPAQLQPGDFDYTVDDPDFSQLVEQDLGDNGDPTDGVDAMIQDLEAAAQAIITAIQDDDGLLPDPSVGDAWLAAIALDTAEAEADYVVEELLDDANTIDVLVNDIFTEIPSFSGFIGSLF